MLVTAKPKAKTETSMKRNEAATRCYTPEGQDDGSPAISSLAGDAQLARSPVGKAIAPEISGGIRRGGLATCVR